MNFGKQLKEGLITQNPVLVQVLGMCSTMAITTSFFNGLGMGVSVLIILTLSNIFISLLRKIIPNEVRIACYIVVIAGFVTCVDLLLKAFVPALSSSLGVFIPLIVVNCIILGRAEGFASKNGVGASAVDGIAFTQTLREGNCDLPVLMVTARVTQEDKRRGFRAGTDDYMVKPVDEDEMLWRIEALLRRYRSTAERRLTVGGTVLDRSSLQVITPTGTEQLTAKEFLLLFKLLAYPRTLFTKRQLIDDIWDLDSTVDEHTVEVYISRLRDRFRGNPDFELRTLRGLGYMGLPREDAHGQK